MAENEILDIKGRRWRDTRRLLLIPNTSSSEIAKCAITEFEAGVRRDLNACLKNGQPLLDLLRAAEGAPGGLREAVLIFKNRTLARIVRNAIEDCGAPLTSTRVAERAAELLAVQARDKVLGHAALLPEYAEEPRRKALCADVTEGFRKAQDLISEHLERALEGEKLNRANFSRKPRRSPGEQITDVLSQSLLPRGIARHGPRR
jgi:hypothetical protein